MTKIFGLLPAAGMAMRMRPFRYPKELLPVQFTTVKNENFVRPKLLIEYALQSFSLAGVSDTFIVVPEWKPEIMRYLENGADFGHNITYLYNSKALGLADALNSGYSWLKDDITCFAMPDTVFSPAGAFNQLLSKMQLENADLVLGVFPTDEAKHFAPVEFDLEGKVLNVWEKPEKPKFNNAWGIATWNQGFWRFFNLECKELDKGASITEIFDRAAKNGLKVFAVFFSEGWYRDVGRIDNIPLIDGNIF